MADHGTSLLPKVRESSPVIHLLILLVLGLWRALTNRDAKMPKPTNVLCTYLGAQSIDLLYLKGQATTKESTYF